MKQYKIIGFTEKIKSLTKSDAKALKKTLGSTVTLSSISFDDGSKLYDVPNLKGDDGTIVHEMFLILEEV